MGVRRAMGLTLGVQQHRSHRLTPVPVQVEGEGWIMWQLGHWKGVGVKITKIGELV